MIPFRPTVDRVWWATRTLHFEQRSSRDYTVVVGPALYADMMLDPNYRHVVERRPESATILGLPIEVDPAIKRGYIHLRHEVIA